MLCSLAPARVSPSSEAGVGIKPNQTRINAAHSLLSTLFFFGDRCCCMHAGLGLTPDRSEDHMAHVRLLLFYLFLFHLYFYFYTTIYFQFNNVRSL